jgi:ribose transport system permease protein
MTKIVGSLALPLGMYLLMFVICRMRGISYFGTALMWRPLLVNIAISATTALAIGLQFKAGRFDFSGGAIMLLAAIIAGNVSKSHGSNELLFVVLSVVICVVLSLMVSALYIWGRNPIVIATIGMALLYESITCIIYNGGGVTLVSDIKLKVFSTYPMALAPFGLALVIYIYYSYATVSGRQTQLLSNNQSAAVSVGINEKKNVMLTYCISGLIFGLATVMFASTEIQRGAFSSLSTVGQLFSNILPVFIGLMVGRFCGDALGTVIGAITLSVMSYGLSAIFSAQLGVAISTIFTGAFIFLINIVNAQGGQWLALLRKRRESHG